MFNQTCLIWNKKHWGNRLASSPPRAARLWDPVSLLFIGYRGSFTGLKLPGREVGQPPPPSSEVKNELSYTSTPPICLQDVNRGELLRHAFLPWWAAIARWVYLFATAWTVREANPSGSEFFRCRPQRPWGPSSLLCNWYPVSLTGLRQPWRGVDHPSPIYLRKLKKDKRNTSTPPLVLHGLF